MARSLLTLTRRTQQIHTITPIRLHPKSVRMASNFNSSTISNITEKEKELTGSDRLVRGGPTAQAQKHAGETISSSAVADIAQGERKITGEPNPVPRGPAATAQSHLSQNTGNQNQYTRKLDSSTISSITQAENEITGQVKPVKGGPTAQAQKHAGEPINSDNLHDITEGEKKVTGGERVKGGPTAQAQSELSTARSG